MSQPDLIYGVHSSDNLPCLQPSEYDPSDRSPTFAEASSLHVTELQQLHQVNQQRETRIYQLEQALDQALACLEDFRLRIQDQEILQEKLGTAEEFVYVQHQAIERLKLELERHRQEQQSLELSLRRNQGVVAEQDKALAALQQDVALAQHKVEELETEIAKQLKLQAQWQQRFQELQQETEADKTRLRSLEQQNAEMQEQILGQARQASEYEAAVQYWKDRSSATQRQMSQLKALIEQELNAIAEAEPALNANTSANAVLSELNALLQMMTAATDEEAHPPAAIPSPRFTTLDVPEFLLRRLTYRTRNNQSH